MQNIGNKKQKKIYSNPIFSNTRYYVAKYFHKGPKFNSAKVNIIL